MITYKLIFSKKVIKFLEKHRELKQDFTDKIKVLASGDFQALHIKSLQGRSNEYRLRIGKWRFLYRMEGDSTINFYDADSRGDVYK